MASPLTHRELLGFRSFQDEETGCVAPDMATLELCRQSFYLKQQNKLMQQQQQQTNNQFQQENAQLKTKIETLRQEVDILKLQQTTTQAEKQIETQSTPQIDNSLLGASLYSTILPIVLFGVVLGSTATLLIRKLIKR